jgi:hypothetical protein
MALIEDLECTKDDIKVCSIVPTLFVALTLTEVALPQDLPEAHEREAISIVQVESTLNNEGPSQQAATERAPSVKRQSWTKTAGHPIETLNLGPVDRTPILEHLISKLRLEMSERYFSVLEEYDIGRTLEESLNPVVKHICEQGKFDLTRYI